MSQTGDDMNVWNTFIQGLKTCCEGISWIAPLLLPSFLGAMAGAYGLRQRKMTRGQVLSAIFWTTVIGAGLAPLAVHYTGAPDKLVYPISFFFGIIAYEKTNNITGIFMRFKQAKDAFKHVVSEPNRRRSSNQMQGISDEED